MALLPIRLFGDPILRERACEVTTFDERLGQLAHDMHQTMRSASGVGLAATQVGVLKRLFTWDNGEDIGSYVNPEIVELSDETEKDDEGCLSFPGLFYPTKRPLWARLQAVDVRGEPIEREGKGHLARIFLHEIDHLNGILFIDHLARHDRKDAMKRIRAGELEHPPPPSDDDGPVA